MDSELQSLRKELADLDDEFSQKVKQLEQRIDVLASTQALAQPSTIVDSARNASEEPGQKNVKATADISLPSVERVPPSIIQSASSTQAAPIPTRASTVNSRAVVKEVSKQSMFAALAPLFGPLAGLLEQFTSLYQHYQKQGKAPVFFMTLTGVVALVFGFGYLLQYSFSEYLGPTGKMVIGFVIAIATTVGGIRFTKKRPDMAEYGSSIIALGVVLNYLCAYFAGPYYGLLPDLAGFLLLVAVTAIAYLLALLFETRIVAIVTLVGGAAMPLVMGHVDHSPLLYLSYLLVLAAAMLNLSQRIRWPQLALVSMVLSAGMVEFSIANREGVMSTLDYGEPYGLIAIIHGFFYVFGHYALRGLSATSAMTKARLMIVTANGLFYLLVSQQLVEGSVLLGVIYLVNVLPWLVVFLVPSKVFGYSVGSDAFRAVQALALLHAGLLAGVGILVLSSPELMGIIWCLEALMLVYLGGKFNFSSVRTEGYIALLLSLLAMASQVVIWVLDSLVAPPVMLALTLDMDGGWVNLIAITLLVYGAVALLTRQRDCLSDRECALLVMLDNLFSVCLSLSFLLTIGVFWPEGLWLFAIVPMFYLVWRAQGKGLVMTELLGLTHFLLLLVPVVVSAGVVGNFHFSEQSVVGQIARVEAFVSLWLIAEFYKRFCSQSAYIGFAENLRKFFYCLIPVLFLPSILRQHSEYFPLALWLSSSIALLLYYRLQFTVLKHELRLLVSVASIVAIASCWLVKFENWQGNATAALMAGLAFYLFIGWLGQGLRKQPTGSTQHQQLHWAMKPLFTLAVYYFGIASFIILYGITENVELAMLVVLVYFSGLFFYRPVLQPIRSNLRVVYGLIFVLFSLLTLSHVISVITHRIGDMHALMLGLLNVIGVACVAWLVYGPYAQNRAVWRVAGGQIGNVWVFNLIMIAAYVSLLAQLFSTMLGPVISFSLVVHGTVILFQTIQPKMKKLIWLSMMLYGVAAVKVLLWDMNDFSLVQKIVVFMLIGLSMLGAAFKFQKVMAREAGASSQDGLANNVVFEEKA